MLFATDTCFWEHFHRVFSLIQWDIRPYLQNYLWGITAAVQKELIYYNLSDFIPFNDAQLIPIKENELENFLKKYPFLEEYDLADQTLLFSCIRDGNQLLTDDGGLFIEAQALNLQVLNVPLFSLYLVRDDIISKKEVFRLLHHWEEHKSYSKKDIRRWFKTLQQL